MDLSEIPLIDRCSFSRPFSYMNISGYWIRISLEKGKIDSYDISDFCESRSICM